MRECIGTDKTDRYYTGAIWVLSISRKAHGIAYEKRRKLT